MSRWKLVTLLSSVSLLCTCVFVHAADQLEGHVKQSNRIARPGQGANGAGKPLSGVLSTDSFKLGAQGASLSGAADQTSLNGKADDGSAHLQISQPELALPASVSTTSGPSLTSGVSAQSNPTKAVEKKPEHGGGGGAEPPIIDDYNAKRPLSGSITFRFCYYDLGDGAESTWEGLRDANYLLGRGVDIALMLDRGGVRLANKHNMQEYQLHRGSTERMIKTQQMFQDFVAKGGKVYVSERWARTFGMWGGSYPSLAQGVTLLGDEEMADLLVERTGRIIEY